MKNHIAVGTTFLVFSQVALAGQKAKQPNFLIISCEDLSPYLSFYGDTHAKTPNLDSLAKESLILDNAFAAVGVSGPSRSSIITGMYPISIGTQQMRTANDVFGWGNRDYGSQLPTRKDQQGESFGPYSVVTPPDVRCFTTYLRKEGYFCANNYKTDYQFTPPLSSWDELGPKASYVNRNPDQPFLAIYNINHTHESQIWENAHEPLTVDPKSVPLHSYWPDTDTVRRDMARNYANIEKMDRQVGEILQELKRNGLYEDTYILFFSDHGGPLPRGKRAVYDSGLKVPFLIKSPKGMNAGRTNRLFSFVDIAPTILSLANVKVPECIQGQAFLGQRLQEERDYVYGSADRFDECYDRVRSIRDKNFLLVKNYFPEKPRYMDIAYRKKMPMMREMLRLRDQGELNKIQMIWFEPTKPRIEFFDVKNDPEQVHDLASDPKYKEQVDVMLNALNQWEIDVDDKGGIPEAQWVASFWPNFKQPQTENPLVKKCFNRYKLRSKTKGSDLVYRIEETDSAIAELNHWQVYNKSITPKKGAYLHVRATRIGYKDSEEIIVKMQ